MQIHGLKKEFGDHLLFENASLTVNPGGRIGLVGRNGAGKSTFFKILLGELAADAGEVVLPRGHKLGALSQHIKFTESSLIAEASLALPPGKREQTYLVEKILFGLGFVKSDLEKDPWSFSGGFQIRLNLAKALLGEPNILLLDEPTNYLDILSIRWLKRFLRLFPGEVILITHDRGFMDDVVTHVVGITRRELRKVKGKTADYYETIAAEDELYEKTRINQDKKRKEMESFVERFRAKANKAAQAQSRLKQLEKMEVLEGLSHEKSLAFRFRYEHNPAKTILEAHDLAFGYEGQENLFDNLSFTLGSKDRLAIIGKNGKGKSTLLNVLAGVLDKRVGSISFHQSLALGHFGQTNVECLDPNLTVEQEIQSANPNLSRSEVRSIAGLMMFEGDASQKLIKVLSGGEKSRVLLGKILSQKTNLLFLDEPTNHLDMESIDALTAAIEQFEGAVCLVTHNEDLLRRVANRLIIFKADGAEYFYGNYDDFLEKVGWDEDETEGGQGKKKRSHKELKLLRSELILQRSRELKPYQAQSEQLETVIEGLEKVLGLKEEKLLQASQKGEGQLIASLSTEIAELNQKIEELFIKLSENEDELQKITARYELSLGELDS